MLYFLVLRWRIPPAKISQSPAAFFPKLITNLSIKHNIHNSLDSAFLNRHISILRAISADITDSPNRLLHHPLLFVFNQSNKKGNGSFVY
jgi:hypothetical protein